MIDMLLIIGLILIALGFLVALPIFGFGLVIPVVGDVIDIPISAVFVLLGAFLLIISSFGFFISQYWWIILVGFALWYGMFVLKIGVGTKRRKLK